MKPGRGDVEQQHIQGILFHAQAASLDRDNLLTAHTGARATGTLPASNRARWQEGEDPREGHDTHLVVSGFVVGTLLLTVAGEVSLRLSPLQGNEFSIHTALRILRIKGFVSP